MRCGALVVALALAPLGCGGAAGGRTGRGAVARGANRASYRWLAATAGPAPSVAAENRAGGSDAWRALDRDTRSSAIDVYVSAQDVRPGGLERIFVRARRAREVGIRIFRIGWYGGAGARLMLESAPLRLRRQPACRHQARTGLTECNWHATLTLALPRALPSGVYVVDVIAGRGRQRAALFVLEAQRAAPLVAHISTATYEAYNDWGGDSLYPGGRPVAATGTGQGVEVSYDRPYATLTGAGELFARDVAAVRYLERAGLPVSYVTSTATTPARLAGARALIDIGHSEYWSAAERGAFERARDSGTSLAFISSDTADWRVRYAGRRIVAYKEFARRDPSAATGEFADRGAALTGSAYLGCITPRRPTPGRASYRYYDWTFSGGPAWVAAGTGLHPGDTVRSILGYELDRRTRRSPPALALIGRGSAPCQHGAGVAETTLYRARSGALVFATGTLGWVFGLAPLADPSADVARVADPRLVRLTGNVLGRMLGPR